MAQVTLLKDFTKAIVSIEGEDIDVEELGDLPLSIVVNGKANVINTLVCWELVECENKT